MEMITSNKNEKIKNLQALLKLKKERDRQGVFVIEGFRIFKDTLETAPGLIESIFVSESFLSGGNFSTLKDKMSSAGLNQRLVTVKDMVFESISQTVTPQGIMCIVKKPAYKIEEITEILSDSSDKEHMKILLLENIQDPGNLGTMLRTAEAAGVSGIVMSRDCADIFNPKVVRSTMGSIFRVPFIYAEDFCAAVKHLKAAGITIYAAYLHGGVNYTTVHYDRKSAVMIGNEGNGLTDDAVSLADKRLYIPMEGKIESLNAAVAAAILLYHDMR